MTQLTQAGRTLSFWRRARTEGRWPGRAHLVDALYACSTGLRFDGGWGDEAKVDALGRGFPLVEHPQALRPTFGPFQPRLEGLESADGSYLSPLIDQLPAGVGHGRVRWLRKAGDTQPKATVLVFAGSGEEGYALRERVFSPLAREGIHLWMVENSFYGARRARGQRSAELPTVSEQGLLNYTMVEEGRALATGLAGMENIGRLGITGYSLGGFTTSMVAATVGFPISAAVLAGGNSPAPVYTEGFLSASIDFTRLDSRDPESARRRLAAAFHESRLTLRPPPLDLAHTVLFAHRGDGYVPPEEVETLARHWKGVRTLWTDEGHISAYIMSTDGMRQAVRMSLE